MAKIAKLLAKTSTVIVDLGDGDTLLVVYRPSGVTPEMEAAMMNRADGSRWGLALVEFLLKTMTDWDLQGDDEKPYPISAESLSGLPIQVLSAVARAITQDMRPNAPNAAASNGGLPAAA